VIIHHDTAMLAFAVGMIVYVLMGGAR